jgi:hypothetical protein
MFYLQTVHARQVDVQQYDVWDQLLSQAKRFETIIDLGDDVQVVFVLQDPAQALAEDWMIVHEHD